MTWMRGIWDEFIFWLSLRRGTYEKCTFEEAIIESWRRFPNSPAYLIAEAKSELFMRELFRQRKYDA